MLSQSLDNIDFDGDEINLSSFVETAIPDLNDDVLTEIALNSDPGTIFGLCSSSPRYNRLICDNQNFWHQRFKQDYFDIKNYAGSWKQLYLNYGSLYSTQLYLIPGQYLNKEIGFKPSHLDGDIAVDKNGYIWIYRSGLINPGLINPGYLPKGGPGWIKIPNLGRVKQASISMSYHPSILYIDQDDNVYLYSIYGYGIKPLNTAPTPFKIQNIKAKQVSLSHNHAVILDIHGDVYIFGYDPDEIGYLGLGDITRTAVAIKLPNIRARYVTCEAGITAIIDLDNRIHIFGNNDKGQLGLGHSNLVNTPQIIQGFAAKSISVSGDMVVFTDLNDRVYIAGYNLAQRYTTIPELLMDMPCRSVKCYYNHNERIIAMIDLDHNLYYMQNTNSLRLIKDIKAEAISIAPSRINFIGSVILN